MNITKQLNR